MIDNEELNTSKETSKKTVVRKANEPTDAFIGASWFALIIGMT